MILRKEVLLQTSDACMTDKLAGNYKSIISYSVKFVYIKFIYLIGRKLKILPFHQKKRDKIVYIHYENL